MMVDVNAVDVQLIAFDVSYPLKDKSRLQEARVNRGTTFSRIVAQMVRGYNILSNSVKAAGMHVGDYP